MKRFIKELLLFIVIFIFVAFIVHIDKWLTNPIEHLNNLTRYGLPWHPLLYAIIIYIIILLIRLLFTQAMRYIKKDSNNL